MAPARTPRMRVPARPILNFERLRHFCSYTHAEGDSVGIYIVKMWSRWQEHTELPEHGTFDAAWYVMETLPAEWQSRAEGMLAKCMQDSQELFGEYRLSVDLRRYMSGLLDMWTWVGDNPSPEEASSSDDMETDPDSEHQNESEKEPNPEHEEN